MKNSILKNGYDAIYWGPNNEQLVLLTEISNYPRSVIDVINANLQTNDMLAIGRIEQDQKGTIQILQSPDLWWFIVKTVWNSDKGPHVQYLFCGFNKCDLTQQPKTQLCEHIEWAK